MSAAKPTASHALLLSFTNLGYDNIIPPFVPLLRLKEAVRLHSSVRLIEDESNTAHT